MIRVVNMIPAALSAERWQDSEPSLTVNPSDPAQIAASAFTLNPIAGGNAPIYVSSDAGRTWALNAIVPSQDMTGDISLAFSSLGNRLYAGILRRPGLQLAIARTDDAFGTAAMTILETRARVDQPFLAARSEASGGATADRLWAGLNDFAVTDGRTATLDWSDDATGAAPSGLASTRIDVRTTGGQDGPSIRPAANRDGRVYGAFFHWRRDGLKDVVVVRDDANGDNGFDDLTDPSDGLSGRIVASGLTIPWTNSSQSDFGQERGGSTLAIAVDPEDSSRVYVAYGDKPAANWMLHVHSSHDHGDTWTEIRTVQDATNPAIAVTSSGVLALLFQLVAGLPGALNAQRWHTMLLRTADEFQSYDEKMLADTPADDPTQAFLPYLGDYLHMVAVDNSFYAVFSASNRPEIGNFPTGVRYQRNADFAARQLHAVDGVTPVPTSIDPFFVAASPPAPAVTARHPDQLDVFTVAHDGHVYTSWWTGGHEWSGLGDRWREIGGVFPVGGDVAAVARQPEQLDLFVCGNDGHVYTSWWTGGHDWSGLGYQWREIGGVFPPEAPVAATARRPEQLDLFVCGNDGHVYTSWWTGGHDWSGLGNRWREIGGVFPAAAPVTAVARTEGQLDLFVCGNDGHVYTSWWTEGRDWSGLGNRWRDIGGVFPPGARVAAVARQPEQLDLFVCGNDGHVYTSWWTGGHDWSGLGNRWREIGGVFPAGAPVSVVARQPEQLDVFVCGNDGHVYTSWWTGGHDWSGLGNRWRDIGGVFPRGAPVAAVARQPEQLDLFVAGNDARVYTSWWTGGHEWSGLGNHWRDIGGHPPTRPT